MAIVNPTNAVFRRTNQRFNMFLPFLATAYVEDAEAVMSAEGVKVVITASRGVDGGDRVSALKIGSAENQVDAPTSETLPNSRETGGCVARREGAASRLQLRIATSITNRAACE